MICPFCGKEMEQGALSGDGRSNVWWETGEKRSVRDLLAGKGMVELKRTRWGKFVLEGEYCPACEKMIFSARVRK